MLTLIGIYNKQNTDTNDLILKNLLTLKVKINLDGDSLHLFLIYSKIGCEA